MKPNEIYKIYGTEYGKMTENLLEAADLSSLIREKCESKGISEPVIGIKPNLMSCIPAEFGATTHPEIVEAIIEFLQRSGFRSVIIMEGSWVGDRTEEAFDICGYNAIKEKYGTELRDMQKDGWFQKKAGKIFIKLCNSVKDVDFLINVPVLKGHCQTNFTCALKNMKGLIPNCEKRRFHAMGLHEPIGLLNGLVRQDFIVTDHICGDLECESGGNPFRSDCIMASRDPVLTDAYAGRLLGYTEKDVPYVSYAEKAGAGSADVSGAVIKTLVRNPAGAYEALETDTEEALPVTHRILKLKDNVKDVDTCSACYESLMRALSRLKEEGLLENFTETICIGQGNRGKTGKFGVGNCTSLFDFSVKGCPPEPDEIYGCIKSRIVTP